MHDVQGWAELFGEYLQKYLLLSLLLSVIFHSHVLVVSRSRLYNIAFLIFY